MFKYEPARDFMKNKHSRIAASFLFLFTTHAHAISNYPMLSSEENRIIRDLKTAESNLRTRTYAPESEPLVNDSICVIRRPGNEILKPISFSTKALCLTSCEEVKRTLPSVSCIWRGKERNTNVGSARCLIRTGGDFSTLSDSLMTLERCANECNSFEASRPNRICDWGNDRLKNPNLGTECRVRSAGNTELVKTSFRMSLSACQNLCNSGIAATDPYRRCQYGSNVFRQPSEKNSCEIFGGAGRVLQQPFYTATNASCLSVCNSFTATHPKVSCFFGRAKIR